MQKQSLGFGVWGLGFRVRVLGVLGLGFLNRNYGSTGSVTPSFWFERSPRYRALSVSSSPQKP